MSEGFVQVAPDSTGKQLRAILRTVNAQPVYDEVFELSDQSGTLVTPISERDLVPDGFMGSTKSGLPAFGYDNVYLASYPIPLNNGTVVVSGSVSASVSGNLGGVPFNQAGPVNMSALNTTVTINLSASGFESGTVLCYLNVASSSTGTLVFEISADNTTWFSVNVKNLATGKWQSSVVNPLTTASGLYIFPSNGTLQYRVRTSAWTAGNVIATLIGSGYKSPHTQTTAGVGTSIPLEAVFVGGSDGVNIRVPAVKNANPLSTDFGMHMRSLFQQLPGSALPSHVLALGASDTVNLQALLVESASNPNLLTGVRQGANQLGINGSGQIGISNFPATQPVSGTVNSIITDPVTPTQQAGVTSAGQQRVVQDFVQMPKYAWGIGTGWGTAVGW